MRFALRETRRRVGSVKVVDDAGSRRGLRLARGARRRARLGERERVGVDAIDDPDRVWVFRGFCARVVSMRRDSRRFLPRRDAVGRSVASRGRAGDERSRERGGGVERVAAERAAERRHTRSHSRLNARVVRVGAMRARLAVHREFVDGDHAHEPGVARGARRRRNRKRTLVVAGDVRPRDVRGSVQTPKATEGFAARSVASLFLEDEA